MTMPSSGPIRMSQAIAEVQQSGQRSMNDSLLRQLALKPSGQYSFSDWRNKTFGIAAKEKGTQYFNTDYSGACGANFGYSLLISRGGGFVRSGGETTVTGEFPSYAGALAPGLTVAGYFRSGNWLTLIISGPAHGMVFKSSLGDNAVINNGNSRTIRLGPNLWTFYAIGGQPGQSGAERITYVRLEGTATAGQPVEGSINGNPPAGSGGTGGTTPGGNH